MIWTFLELCPHCDNLAGTKMIMELKIGDSAPDFRAPAVGGIYGGGQEVKLDGLRRFDNRSIFLPQGRYAGVHNPRL